MYEKFTNRARKVMQLANQEAQRFNHEYLGAEHMLLGLIREGSGVATNVLHNLGFDLRKIRLNLEKVLQAGPDMITMGKLPYSAQMKRVIENSMEEARDLNHAFVGTEHLLLALLGEKEGLAAQVFEKMGVDIGKAREQVNEILGVQGPREESKKEAPVPMKKPLRPARDSLLGRWTRSLTTRAKTHGEAEPAVLDQATVDKILLALVRRQKNNVLLVGNELLARKYVDHLAFLSAQDPFPDALFDLDVRKMLMTAPTQEVGKAGETATVSRFSDRVLHCFNETLSNGNIALVVDGLDRLYRIELEGVAQKLGEALKPWFRNPSVRCIGLVDPNGRKTIAKTRQLDLFEVIELPPLTIEQTRSVMTGVVPVLEQHHICKFSEQAVESAIESVGKQLSDCDYFPSEVERLLDDAAAKVRMAVKFSDEEIGKMEARIRIAIREIAAHHSLGYVIKAFEAKERLSKLLSRRIEMGELPTVGVEDVVRATQGFLGV